MLSQIKPIAANEVSYNVSLLHQILDVLGLPVSKAEVQAHRAGGDTVEKTRALLERLRVQADPNDSTILNDAAIAAIAQELERRGLTTADRTFTVAGLVTMTDRSIKGRQRLLAFDLDLRGVGVYRTLDSLGELDKNGGFEFLGESESDGKGRYRITFYDWQYRRAERKLADVVVFAVAAGRRVERGGRIVGRSRLVATHDYSDTGLVENLTVVCGSTDERTEYEVLMSGVNGFLKENEVTFAEVVGSDDQIDFIASELDLDLARVRLAAAAERLGAGRNERLSHEMLYGLGRQDIELEWVALATRTDEELSAAIEASSRQKIIRAFSADEMASFLRALRPLASREALKDPGAETKGGTVLSNALPGEEEQVAFLDAVNRFTGTDFREFWTKHLPAQPEFRDRPELISGLLVTHQLTALSGNHQRLVRELRTTRNVQSVDDLFDLENDDWIELAKRSGVPDFVNGADEDEKARNYADRMQGILDAAFPTKRIAKMVEKQQLPIHQTAVSRSIGRFLSNHAQFDFATSRIDAFNSEIEAVAGANAGAVKTELKRIQRVFQVSTHPEAMTALMESKLDSAYSIANTPRQSFLKTYAASLGGEAAARAIHERASHVAARVELSAMTMMEYSHGATPSFVMDSAEYALAMETLQNQVPNYSELFGSPSLCECEHCRSVYSAAAYFVDLLRFLWRGEPNSDGKTPLDLLGVRRPDLLHLPLTCENTNTIIPYVDLANEVMEYYTANGSLTGYEGHDTGEASAEELRANPQNLNLDAYRKLKAATYPFTLPYHQPLDSIRTYGDQLGVRRYEALDAINPEPDAATRRALSAEQLRLSPEEYRILTGEALDGTADTTALHEYYGYAAPADLEKLSGVPELLHRSGLNYAELVELVKTQFVNPFQATLDFLEPIVTVASIDAGTFYTRLGQIEAGALHPANDPDLTSALTTHNAAAGTSITPAEFGQWVEDHFAEFRQVLTLFEPESRCDLDTTRLRTLESIYENLPTSGITSDTWSRIHRFIRLWRRLGWTIHEVDLMLGALGEDDLGPGTLARLEYVSRLLAASKLKPNLLAALWGDIDSYGDKSLYTKLFLSRSVPADEAFEADAWGDYLGDPTEMLADHRSTLLASFRIREEDLDAILEVARVIDGGSPRVLDPATDELSLPYLSTIYRHVVLAKALKMRVTDLCRLIDVFDASPFSTWDLQQKRFIGGSPEETWEFYDLAAATKRTGFKPAVLEYILDGTLPAESRIGLSEAKALGTARAIRDAFDAIEQSHPDSPASPLTTDLLAAKLALTFQPEMVTRLLDVIQNTAVFEVITDANLDVTIPPELADKYTYIKASGRLLCVGVMTDDESTTLKGLANASPDFKLAVDDLYALPEELIDENFGGVFTSPAAAHAMLLDHPAQAVPAELDAKLSYVYERFVPILKGKLRRDAIAQHVASLIGLDEASTALLIASEVDALIAGLSTAGFSATYYSDATFGTEALSRVDETVDFDWEGDAPAPAVPADHFSATWGAYLAAPASGEYTLVVEVEETDESFRLYLDDTLVLEKAAGDPNTSWEVLSELNAAQMHRILLEYVEGVQSAGVRLIWKTATTALEVIPARSAYPAQILDEFMNQAVVWHRAAKFLSGFELSTAELDHFLKFGADFAGIDFSALTTEHWRRISEYSRLRDAAPQAQATLVDVFAAANMTSPAPTVDELEEELLLATAWDEESVDFLVATHFALTVDDFKNEIALNRIREVMGIARRSGLSATTIAEWGSAETDFDVLAETATLLRNAVKAKYNEDDWLEIAGDLSDRLRARQRDALTQYLLTRPAIEEWGAKDADGLFEYFLIDVQMGACMDTSRIVQANASVQMFVNRCLLNLESDTSSGPEKGVSPGSIDKNRWEWMKNYRVWEANRKVFLYPENWLEPDWRNDRSEFFRELESYLVQNDITSRSVEQAFRDYLSSLNQVANLEVCGLHKETYDDGSLRYLHVFARTRNSPYKFFYRRWNEYRKWSAWERVPLDIRVVGTGAYSGVHLVPVVWKQRLFLFWPEFQRIEEEGDIDKNQTTEQMAKKTISSFDSKASWEIRLAWSEYLDGKWSQKQVSQEYVQQRIGTVIPRESVLRWIYRFAGSSLFVTSHAEFDGAWHELGRFYTTDIAAPIGAGVSGFAFANQWPGYGVFFENFRKTGKLELLGDEYLRQSTSHRLLLTPTRDDYGPRLTDPFFFSDWRRTYFVRPVDITIIDLLREPFYTKPILPWVEAEIRKPIPIDKSRIPIEELLPIDRDRGGFGGGLPIWDRTFAEIGPGYLGRTLAVTSSRPGSASMPVATAAPVTAMRPAEAAALELRGGDEVSLAKAPAAFAGMQNRLGIDWQEELRVSVRWDKGLEFHTFYHPYAGRYVERLNGGGLGRLLTSDTSLPSDNGSSFEASYQPNFTYGLVQKPTDFASRTYYKENVCFDPYGANSLYNWELFFHAPLYIATRLSRNGKFEEALQWFHQIFDPTTDAVPGPGESEVSRYWKVLPFKTTPAENLEDWFRSLSPNTDPNTEDAVIGEWRDNPFDPHKVAANRPLAYMKHVVLKYVENLVAWADSLFRQDTMESVNEALQLYVLAAHILGPRPQTVPRRGEVAAETYASLEDKWDDFSNALVALENVFPFSSEAAVSEESTGTSLLGVGSALYFCIPSNEKLLEHWDTVEDRLYKIRHCQNIDGVERKLALFAPPIDPGALIQAFSQGLSLGSILADLSSPPPIYRFAQLIRTANEFCSDVREFGAALLAALEKKDVEELSRLRASHEVQILELNRAVRERQLLDAKAYKQGLEKSRDIAKFRLEHYNALLGNPTVTVPGPASLPVSLTAETSLPPDTLLTPIATDVDQSLEDTDTTGVKLIKKEKKELDKLDEARKWQIAAQASEALAAIAHVIPTVSADGKPFGVGAGASWGGTQLGNALSAAGKIFDFIGAFSSHEAMVAAKMANYIRREQDWTLQANLAAKEIIQLDKQILSADIRVQIAEKELAAHQQQIENSQAVETFLAGKFTNQELYQWMKEQLFAVYKQSYNLAYDMAKKAEKAYRYETGVELSSFIQYGYWDNSMQGLVAGEKLQLALRQLEKSYLEDNARELELTKSISLARLDPLALIELRETGKCSVSIPEELFDLDFRGHYFRSIKGVRLSIPCVAGPYTSVSCSLRLLKNSVRVNTSLNSEGNYEHENDEGLWIDDDRFTTRHVPVTAIATSSAQNDPGLFEFNFRDDRYLPFEGAGAISDWQIELSTEKSLRQFDYSTISDILLHLHYTARESGGLFQDKATAYIKDFLANAAELMEQPLMQLVSLKYEFPTEWYRFLHPAADGDEQILSAVIDAERFPFFTRGSDLVVEKIDLFARSTEATTYHAVVTYVNDDEDTVTSSTLTLAPKEAYGGLNHVTINVTDAGLNLEELKISEPVTLKIKRAASADYTSLATNPDELNDILMVFHYRLASDGA